MFAVEPPLETNPLLRCNGFHGTPHIGGATFEAQVRVGTQLAEAVLVALEGGVPDDGVVLAGTSLGDSKA